MKVAHHVNRLLQDSGRVKAGQHVGRVRAGHGAGRLRAEHLQGAGSRYPERQRAGFALGLACAGRSGPGSWGVPVCALSCVLSTARFLSAPRFPLSLPPPRRRLLFFPNLFVYILQCFAMFLVLLLNIWQ